MSILLQFLRRHKKQLAMLILLAMIIELIPALSATADAASSIPSGCYRVTLKNYNTGKSTYQDVPGGSNAYITLPKLSSTASATFLGWKDGNTFYKGGDRLPVTGHKTVVTVWQCLVNFYNYNGVQLDQRAEKTGYKYSLPSAPARAGYTFDGWYTSTGEKVTADTIVTKAYKHDLTARYIISTNAACDIIDEQLNGNHTYASTQAKEPHTGYMALITNGNSTLCTIGAKADLLNRRLVLDDFRNNTNIYSSGYSFNVRDAIVGSCKTTLSNISYKGKSGDYYLFTYSGGDKLYADATATFTNGWTTIGANNKYKKTYTYVNVAYFAYEKDLCDVKADLKALLKQHPEGIYIYTSLNTTDPNPQGGYLSPHAILLVNYDDKYFYAVDTGGVRRDTYKKDYDSTCKLDDTYLNSIYATNKETGKKRYNNADDILHHIVAYGYIK